MIYANHNNYLTADALVVTGAASADNAMVRAVTSTSNLNTQTVNQQPVEVLKLVSPSPLPVNTIVATLSTPATSEMWYGGVYAPNGKVYMLPRTYPAVLVIDPATNTTSFIPVTMPDAGGRYWAGGCLYSDGKIYCVPRRATNILVVDTHTDTVDTTFVFGFPFNSNLWAGVVLRGDKLYGMPVFDAAVLILDPHSPVTPLDSVDPLRVEYSNSLQVLVCPGAVFTADVRVGDNLLITTSASTYMGYIQAVVSDTALRLVYNLGVDLVAGTVTAVRKTRRADVTSLKVSLPAALNYNGGVLGFDNNIYGLPLNAGRVLIVNPDSPVTNIGVTPSLVAYTNSTRVLTCPGATFLTSLVRGDNVFLQLADNTLTGHVQAVTSDTTLILVLALGVDLLAGSVLSVRKSRQMDITTISMLPGNLCQGGCLTTIGKIFTGVANTITTRLTVLDPTSPLTNIPGASDNVTSVVYNNSTRVLTCAPATFLRDIAVGDNVVITLASNTVTGYVDEVLTDSTLRFILALGVTLISGDVRAIQKTRKADITTFRTPFRYHGCVAAPNGLVYYMPASGTAPILVVDPVTLAITKTIVTPTGAECAGGVLTPAGTIYTVPLQGPQVLVVSTGLPTQDAWCLQAAFNKF